MFLYLKKMKLLPIYLHLVLNTLENLKSKSNRKAILSPRNKCKTHKSTGTFFFAPLCGSQTVEAAVVLPIFLFAMITVLQYGNAMNSAVRFGTALSETGKQIAASAYVTKFGGDISAAPEIVAGALTAAYAQGAVMSKSGNPDYVRNENMLLSTFLKDDQMIDLVLTYQIKTPIGLIRLPGYFFLQRARVRAWTGREGSGGKSDEKGGTDEQNELVYVTETGKVYHDDPECTYLKLSIQEISADRLASARNRGGGKYHRCEKCGEKNPSGSVYITKEGDRYHSSLNCSGLKRTVHQVSKEDLGGLKACSKCGGH